MKNILLTIIVHLSISSVLTNVEYLLFNVGGQVASFGRLSNYNNRL